MDAAFAGRAYAAYNGVYVAASLAWLRVVEGVRPVDGMSRAHAAAVQHLVAATMFGEKVTADMADERGPNSVRSKAELLRRMAVFSRRAVLEWDGEIPDGSGKVTAGSSAFTAGAIFSSIAGDPPGRATPEELLAASHATCYGIGLRSLIPGAEDVPCV